MRVAHSVTLDVYIVGYTCLRVMHIVCYTGMRVAHSVTLDVYIV